MSRPFLIFGHRGSPKRFPENTLASFDEALRSGADGFETDLRLLSDGTAILFHDDEVGDVRVESLRASDVRAERLIDLARYTDRATMILEVKRGKWEDELLRYVGQWSNAVIASFDHTLIDSLHRRGVSVSLGITTCDAIADIAGYAARLGATWCFPAYRYVDRDMVDSLHEREIRIVPWTPNRAAEWQELAALGCDGVITDVPHEAVQWRARA